MRMVETHTNINIIGAAKTVAFLTIHQHLYTNVYMASSHEHHSSMNAMISDLNAQSHVRAHTVHVTVTDSAETEKLGQPLHEL